MVDIKNRKFNKLTAINFSSRDKFYNQFWMFKCDCGVIKEISKAAVVSGHTTSCGCYSVSLEIRKKRGQSIKTHGMRNTRIYSIWKNILGRTRCMTNSSYIHYGGRGIKTCKKWYKFENFYKDMENGYNDNLTIDRINNNKGYSKENCRWITMKKQNRNKRDTILFKGETAAEASIRLGGALPLVSARILRGWSKEKAFTTKVIHSKLNVKKK